MSKMRCPACKGGVQVGADGQPVCGECGWGSDSGSREDDPDDGFEMVDGPRPELGEAYPYRPRKKKKKRTEYGPRGTGLPGYFIGLMMILGVWAALAKAATLRPEAAYLLIVSGIVTNLIGLVCVFFCASRDGVERLRLLGSDPMTFGGRGVWIAITVMGLIEWAVTPIFCLVYLAFSFQTAWKPVLIYALGLAMLASGIVFAVRS